MAGKCPFGYDNTSSPELEEDVSSLDQLRELKTVAKSTYPSDLFTCKGGAALTTTEFTAKTYEDIVDAVLTQYEKLSDSVKDNNNPRASFAGCLVRTAGHDFMDFRIKDDGTFQGGSDGCINFNDADNLGLAQCLFDANMPKLWSKYCKQVSLADFFVIAAEAVMGRTATSHDLEDRYAVGTFADVLKQNFKYGRTTVEKCEWNVGLMPNPEESCDGLQRIFVDHIYKAHKEPWKMVTAINGAHTLGSAKPQNSGYDGFWSESDQQGVFNNDYYHSLLLKGWGPEPAVGGNKGKNQWKRIDKGQNDVHKQIMLNSDLCLVFKNSGARTLHANNDPGCCTWVEKDFIEDELVMATTSPFCGTTWGEIPEEEEKDREICCSGAADCDLDDDDGSGPARYHVYEFLKSENAFLWGYLDAWTMATENNFANLTAIGDKTRILFDADGSQFSKADPSYFVSMGVLLGTLVASIYA